MLYCHRILWDYVKDPSAVFNEESEMQTGKGGKSENIAWIGGILHTGFLLKIFA